MAIVFDIERYSTADGPGIRTSVFLKGCNLHCPWCHNPEGQGFLPQLSYNPALCVGCGRCLKACPSGAHELRDGAHVLRRDRCLGCMKCAKACYSGALEEIGKEYSASELADLLLDDALFFKNSGGGVTVSGGEALCHADFVEDLFRLLHAHRIHTAIETSLCLPWEKIQSALREADLIMFDVKTSDPSAHKNVIGGSLELIQDNIRRLRGKPLIARTPVVPGFNDSEAVIRSIAGFLSETVPEDLLYYELLSYHALGNDKLEKLGIQHRFECAPPSAEKMRLLAAAARETGLPVRINGKSLPV